MEAMRDQIKNLEEENLQVCGSNLELMQAKTTLTKDNAELTAKLEAAETEIRNQAAALEEKNRLIRQCLDQAKVKEFYAPLESHFEWHTFSSTLDGTKFILWLDA